jgi:hypothetical protein
VSVEKHIKVVGVLNIVYRSFAVLGGIVLIVIAAVFNRLVDFLIRTGAIQWNEIPHEILSIVPIILLLVALCMMIVSVVGIIGAVGVLKRKEWGRIVLLVVSFFNLLRIPLGTILGVYSIWVLLNDEIIGIFNPVANREVAKSAGQ